ncbi:hypothetical protein ACFVW1_54510 [Streptomyces olivochromogenes]|uniref:hypothetical protein n=1 Tax=Streptomyces olivochromogenes TaxID=1963 RepID=UPI0036D9A507
MIVYPQAGRPAGDRAFSPRDVFEFMRGAGLDPDTTDFEDSLFVKWRGGVDGWSEPPS